MWQASGAQFGLHDQLAHRLVTTHLLGGDVFVLTSGDAEAERPLGGVGGGVACTDGARDAVEELVSPGSGPASRSVGAALVRAAAAAAGDTGGGCRMIVAPSEAAAKQARDWIAKDAYLQAVTLVLT